MAWEARLDKIGWLLGVCAAQRKDGEQEADHSLDTWDASD